MAEKPPSTKVEKARIHITGMTCTTCAAAMAASSITVVFNSLCLRKFKPAKFGN